MDFLKYARTIYEWRKTFYLRGNWRTLKQNLQEDSFFPDLERKSRFCRLWDNLWWYLRHGEINPYYNSYGFDVKGLRNQALYLPYRRFRIERNNGNLRTDDPYGYNRVCVLRDKLLFSAYMAKALGPQYVPEDIGRLTGTGEVRLQKAAFSGGAVDFPAFLDSGSDDLFVKKLAGECGDGCYLLENIVPHAARLRVNGVDMTPQALAAETAGSEYIIQRRILQHEALNALNPSCVNTVRIVTVMGKKSRRPHVFGHFLRLGVNTIVDNRATGGIAVQIDDDGVLRGNGFGHHFVCDRHPATGVIFDGWVLPFWQEVKALVLAGHMALPDIPSIGWDVALTPDGPILLEGNDNWELCGIQDTAGGMKERWHALLAM